MRACLASFVSLVLFAWTRPLWAAPMDPAIERLIDPSTAGCRTDSGAIALPSDGSDYIPCKPDHAAFRRLVAQYAFALAPTAMGAQDVAVQLFVSDTGAVFPQNCQLAVSFSGAIGNDVDNLCGGDYTHEDYNAGPMPPTLGAGPFAEQGQAADIVPDKYYVGTNLVVRTGDTTLQMWMRHDALVPLYEAWAFSDLDLDVGGGLGIVMYDSGGLKLEVNTCTSGNPITFASERAAYPDDHAWHFVRVVQKGDTVTGCIDGKKQLTFPAAAGTLASMYRPRFGRNVIWTPSGAFWDGGLDDIRVYNGALPCE